MHHFLSVCEKNDWILIHISETILPRVTRFGQGMDVNDLIVDREGQGDRSKVKVTRLKKTSFGCFTGYLGVQGSHLSESEVTLFLTPQIFYLSV